MAFDHKDGKGSTFQNNQRTNENNRPHMTGSCKIGGKVYYMSTYENSGPKGNYWSHDFKLAEQGGEPARKSPRPATLQQPFDDSDLTIEF